MEQKLQQEEQFLYQKKITRMIKWENFQNIDLKDCSMRGISFIDCNFSGSIMENVIIDSCWFVDCCLDNVKWFNITCMKDSEIESVLCSQDGTLLIAKTSNSLDEAVIMSYDFYSGKNLSSLSTKQDIFKAVLLTNHIVAYTKLDGRMRFCSIQNQKFKFSKCFLCALDCFEFNSAIINDHQRRTINTLFIFQTQNITEN